MLYIFNKTISNSKSILYSLTILYGINEYQSKKICTSVPPHPQRTLTHLQTDHVNRLIEYIHKHLKIDHDVKHFNKNKLNELLENKSIRGIRRSAGLPVRGQRTHTNAKTAKKFKKVFGKKQTKQVIKGKGKKFVKKKK